MHLAMVREDFNNGDTEVAIFIKLEQTHAIDSSPKIGVKSL